jgi:energy-coupling factor transporter ATP-binding protein EcfA2
MKALVFGEIRPFRTQALLEEYEKGEPVLGRLVQIKNGDKLVIGRVVDSYRISDVVKEYNQTKHFSQRKHSPITQAILDLREGTVLEIELITALQDNKRVPLNFLLTPLSEVHFLESFPIQPTDHTGYLGYFWGTDVKAPLILQDFQTLKEAYHFFIAGQTGSGKSTLTQMLLSLYNKTNPNMNFLILDTVGEFTASFEGRRDIFLHLKDVWQGEVEIYTPPENLALEGWEVFKEICLDYGVMQIIGVPVRSVDNAVEGVKAIIDLLKGDTGRSTDYITQRVVEESLRPLAEKDSVLDNFVKKVYKRDQNAQDRVRNAIRNPETFRSFVEKIQEVANLFYTINTNKRTITDVVNDFSNSAIKGKPGKCVVLNFTLYRAGGRLINLRAKYVRETLRALYSVGIDLYHTKGDINLNTLVVLEEAHNYAPKRTDDEELKKLSDEIVKYFIETRKFGIGWACITTRPSNVRREIFEHARVKFIGMGLTSGPDAELLRESFGSDFLNTYKLLPDPSDPLSPKKEVCFALYGPITLLSRQTPDFISIFNTKEEFLDSNKIEKE